MKKKDEELIVIHKKTFLLIVLSIAIIGVLVGYTIGYITVPAKEVYVQKTIEPEKTVLPSTIETQPTKKQDNTTQQNQPESSEKENIKIIREVEATEKSKAEENKELTKTSKAEKHRAKKLTYKKAVYTVQIGAFHEIVNAEALMRKLKEAGINVQIVKEGLYKVRTNYYKKFTDAQKTSQVLRSKGFENFIVKISKNSKGE